MTQKEKRELREELKKSDIQFISYYRKSREPFYFRDNRGLETKHLYFKNWIEVKDWWEAQKASELPEYGRIKNYQIDTMGW